jgi:hypothetical protein
LQQCQFCSAPEAVSESELISLRICPFYQSLTLQ